MAFRAFAAGPATQWRGVAPLPFRVVSRPETPNAQLMPWLAARLAPALASSACRERRAPVGPCRLQGESDKIEGARQGGASLTKRARNDADHVRAGGQNHAERDQREGEPTGRARQENSPVARPRRRGQNYATLRQRAAQARPSRGSRSLRNWRSFVPRAPRPPPSSPSATRAKRTWRRFGGFTPTTC